MFKVRIYLLDTTLELRSNSKAVLAAAMHPFYLCEALGGTQLMVELFHVESEFHHYMIGEYNSISEFTKAFEAVPLSINPNL